MTEKRRRKNEPLPKESLPSPGAMNGTSRSLDVHRVLRAMIVNGQIPPGTILSQQGLSRQLKVSRTPVREALRKLQEEELIEGRPNYRARVMPFNLSQLEALFTARIFMEPLAVSLAVPDFSEKQLGQLGRQIEVLESKRSEDDFDYWLAAHRRFHLMLVANSSSSIRSTIEANCERSDRYLSLFHDRHPVGWWMGGQKEHREIYEVCRSGDSTMALKIVTLHIGRTALDLASQLSPNEMPEHLMRAMEIMLHAATGSPSSGDGFVARESVRRLVRGQPTPR